MIHVCVYDIIQILLIGDSGLSYNRLLYIINGFGLWIHINNTNLIDIWAILFDKIIVQLYITPISVNYSPKIKKTSRMPHILNIDFKS